MTKHNSSNGFDRVAYIVCCIIAIIAIFAMAYSGCLNMLQSKEAMRIVQSDSVSVYEGNCIECYEYRSVNFRGPATVIYYFKLDNGVLLQSLRALIDSSITGFEEMKSNMQDGSWTFYYIPLNVWGVKENWVISIFSEEQVLVSGEDAETAIADEITRWRLVMRASLIMGMVMILCPMCLAIIKHSEKKSKERRLALKKKKREEQKARKLAKKQE